MQTTEGRSFVCRASAAEAAAEAKTYMDPSSVKEDSKSTDAQST